MAAHKENKYALGNDGGRPRKYDTPEDMEQIIDEYFATETVYTIEGLCLALDLDRRTLLNYEKTEGYEEFFLTIKRAKLRVQENLIKRGLLGDYNSTLSIFLLKNNHDYKDQIENKHSGDKENPIEHKHTIEDHKVIFEDYTDENA